MKSLLLALILPFCLISCASPKNFTAPSTYAVHQSIAETRTEISAFRTSNQSATVKAGKVKSEIVQIREVVKDNPSLLLRLSRAEAELDSLTQDLIKSDQHAASADARAQNAEAKLTEADGKIQKLANDANKAETEKAAAVKNYHRLKVPLCVLGAAFVGLLIWKFKIPILALGPWGIGIAVAAPVATFGMLWWFL